MWQGNGQFNNAQNWDSHSQPPPMSLQQSHYINKQNVNWAELAKMWVTHQEEPEVSHDFVKAIETSIPPPPLSTYPVCQPPPPPPPPQDEDDNREVDIEVDIEPQNENLQHEQYVNLHRGLSGNGNDLSGSAHAPGHMVNNNNTSIGVTPTAVTGHAGMLQPINHQHHHHLQHAPPHHPPPHQPPPHQPPPHHNHQLPPPPPAHMAGYREGFPPLLDEEYHHQQHHQQHQQQQQQHQHQHPFPPGQSQCDDNDNMQDSAIPTRHPNPHHQQPHNQYHIPPSFRTNGKRDVDCMTHPGVAPAPFGGYNSTPASFNGAPHSSFPPNQHHHPHHQHHHQQYPQSQEHQQSLQAFTNNFNNDISEVTPMQPAVLNAASRRKLPAWIREGLEKMESEKKKEADEKLKAEKLKKQSILEQSSKDQKADASKFDSDSDEDPSTNIDVQDSSINKSPLQGKSPVLNNIKRTLLLTDNTNSRVGVIGPDDLSPTSPRPLLLQNESSDSGDADTQDGLEQVKFEREKTPELSVEEKEAIMMSKVRKMLTEVLLSVTNDEISDIATNVYTKATRKAKRAPVQQLVISNALTTLTSIGDYSDEEDSDNGSSHNGDEQSELSISEDEEQVKERIYYAKKAYVRKQEKLNQEIKHQEFEALKLKIQNSKSAKNNNSSNTSNTSNSALYVDKKKKDTEEQHIEHEIKQELNSSQRKSHSPSPRSSEKKKKKKKSKYDEKDFSDERLDSHRSDRSRHQRQRNKQRSRSRESRRSHSRDNSLRSKDRRSRHRDSRSRRHRYSDSADDSFSDSISYSSRKRSDKKTSTHRDRDHKNRSRADKSSKTNSSYRSRSRDRSKRHRYRSTSDDRSSSNERTSSKKKKSSRKH